MTSRLQVDQSGKVEQTNKLTVVAYSNERQQTLEVPARVKREVLTRLKRRGHERKAAVLMVFAASLALLLRDAVKHVPMIVIDDEYTNQQRAIKSRLLRYLKRSGTPVPPNILRFGYVGKASPAHRLAISVYRGERAPDHRATVKELWALLE
jgi:hypothetical protein